MAEVQDEEQWLYGDDKGESPKTTTEGSSGETAVASENNEPSKDAEDKDKEPPVEDKPAAEPESTEDNDEEEKENKDDNDSDSDDEPTVTIGKIVKQPDIIRPPPPPTHRAAPTSGLKDDDFTSVGKINGVAAYDYNLMELEEKPWRKPGADLSDYFNYGFNEDTWFKYCERQKALRTNESGVGLVGLGINMTKSASLAFGSSSIPVSIVNENSKYGMGSIKKYNFPPPSHGGHSDSTSINGTTNNNPQVNTIQVMTADRRTYSNKVLMQSGYDDMDFGGYGNQDSNYYNTPPPQNVPPFFSHPPPIHSSSWSPAVPPPGYGAPPPPMPVPPPVPFFIKEEPIDPLDLPSEKRRSKDTDPERDRERRRDRDRDRDREARYRESRRRSRSSSKTRHRKRSRSKSRVVRSKSKSKSRSRSRSHTPSHKHKKKKSKRDRSERERSKSR